MFRRFERDRFVEYEESGWGILKIWVLNSKYCYIIVNVPNHWACFTGVECAKPRERKKKGKIIIFVSK